MSDEMAAAFLLILPAVALAAVVGVVGLVIVKRRGHRVDGARPSE